MKYKINWRKHIKKLYLIASIILFSVGIMIAYMGNKSANPALILLGFGGMAYGFMLFLSWRRQGDVRLLKKENNEEGIPYKPPNSLNIYPDHIDFEFVEVEKAIGLSQKGLNDHKYYYIHQEQIKGEREEFKLPDDDENQRFYDPAEFANPITMVSNKKYFTWSASTMQKVSLGIMALIIAGEIIGLITIEG